MTIPGIWAGPKNKNAPTVVGAHFLQGVAYQNRTWLVKREMREKSRSSHRRWSVGRYLETATPAGTGIKSLSAVLAALVQAHIHDLEGHVLRAGVAHQCCGLQISHANLQSQFHLRSGCQVTAEGRNAACQAGRFNIQGTAFFEVDAHRPDGLSQPHARVPPLPHKS